MAIGSTFTIPASELQVGDLQGFNGEVASVGHQGDYVNVTWVSGKSHQFHYEERLNIHG